MRTLKAPNKSPKNVEPETVRASISFPSDLYEALEAEAKQKKVSLAWVVRDAAERYLSNRPSTEPQELHR
jgi:metal-responsive CopG/Arc/MetJ family transcriptional regulator